MTITQNAEFDSHFWGSKGYAKKDQMRFKSKGEPMTKQHTLAKLLILLFLRKLLERRYDNHDNFVSDRISSLNIVFQHHHKLMSFDNLI